MYYNPYEVLGISPDSTMEEIKKAYRQQSRKYHPDSMVGKSEKEKKYAEDKFKQVQEAYENILKEKQEGSFKYNNAYSNSYSNNATAYSEVISYIQMQKYVQANMLLDRLSERDSYWYYLKSIVSINLGDIREANIFAKTAYEMEPDNEIYRKLLQDLEITNIFYQGGAYEYDSNSTVNNISCCQSLAQMACCCYAGNLCCCC